MKKQIKDNSKQTNMRIILIVFAIGILGLTGWYTLSARANTNPAGNNTSGSPAAKTPQAKPVAEKPKFEPVADWVDYANTKGVYKFKHPKYWVGAEHPEQCGETMVLFGGQRSSVGVCGSDNKGQIVVFAVDGDHRNDMELKSENYSGLKKSEVAGQGVHGTRYEGTVYRAGGTGAVGGNPKDTKVVEYVLYAANGKTYVAAYAQKDGYPDILADFDTMVSKTMTFVL